MLPNRLKSSPLYKVLSDYVGAKTSIYEDQLNDTSVSSPLNRNRKATESFYNEKVVSGNPDVFQVGGEVEARMGPEESSPSQEELEEFKQFLALLVQQGKLKKEQINKQTLPELYKMYKKYKQQAMGKRTMYKLGGLFKNTPLYDELNKLIKINKSI